MIGYVIIIFQSIWTLFYLISSFLKAILVTVGTVVSCLNAFFGEVALFFADVNHRTTAVLDCIAEETTSNINNIAKLATEVLTELSNSTNWGKQQLQNISDAIALATGWSGRTLNGALFFIGDAVWGTVRFIPHLLLMPVVFVYNFIANALYLILLLLARTVYGLLQLPLQSLFALVLIVTILQSRRRILLLFRLVVIRLCNKIYQIFRNRGNFRILHPHATAPVLEGRRNVLRNRRSFSYRIYAFTRDAFLQICQIFVSRGNCPVEVIHNEGSQSESGRRGCSGPKSPINTNSFDNFCVICQERLKCVVLLPCKHLCLCEQCAQRIALYQDTCPLCRIFVRTKMTVYI